MIADMMLFAKPPKPEFVAMDLIAFLRDFAKSFAEDVDVGQASINVDLPSTPVLILADAAQLDAALRAIVKNSVEATGGDGNIDVRCRAIFAGGVKNEGEQIVEIEIHDDGPGISTEVRRHLFDPFYSGREAGRGLGFGLSKAWRIIEMHHGQITVASSAGIGTTFSIHLRPAHTDQE